MCVSMCVSVAGTSGQEACVCRQECVRVRGLEKMAGCGTPCGHLHNFINSISLMMLAAYWYIDRTHINGCVVTITI